MRKMNLKKEREKTIKVAVFWNYQTINILKQASKQEQGFPPDYSSTSFEFSLESLVEKPTK